MIKQKKNFDFQIFEKIAIAHVCYYKHAAKQNLKMLSLETINVKLLFTCLSVQRLGL